MIHARSCAALAGALCFAFGATAPSQAATRPVVAEDLFKVRLLGGAEISPDGSRVAVTQSMMDGPDDTYDSTIDLIDVATGQTIDATRGKHDSDAAWAPDGKSFYFVRKLDKKKPQIYRYTIADQRIAQITDVKEGATGPVPSHDGSRVAFTVVETDPVHDTYVDFAKAGFTPKKSEQKTDVRTIDTMHFEVNGMGYVYDKHQHIWVMNADGTQARALTSGQYSEDSEVWSPDDKTIAFASLRYQSPSLGPNDIYTIASTGGEMHKVTSALPSNNAPTFGNESNERLWFFSGGVGDPAQYPSLVSARLDGSDRHQVVAIDKASWGDALLADMKEGGGACGSILPGDKTMVLNTDGPGYANLKKLDLQTGTFTDLTAPHGEAFSCSVSLDGKHVAYLYSDFLHPADVWVADIDNAGSPRQLTHVNDAYLSSVTLSTPQPFTVKDSAGLTVHAWFMPAINAKPGEKSPTILDIHGGPETQFGDTYFQEFQFWASQGYNVVFSDPRGSVGFGYDFEEALAKNWGNAMFDDVQAVMDAAVQRPDVDSKRLAVLGGSYGGYATLWVVSHTDRYKTAIAERSVSDLQSEQLASDLASDNALGGFYTWGKPWEAGNLYAQLSPLMYVENVHTPLMILHSSEDTRTPIDQTLQEFNALKILGRTVTFVDVPGENHDLSRTGSPIHRVERMNLMADWLKTHL
jgi:dipeptidyl aminopeptidase/acylaminoacyl peptidase